MVTVKYLVGRIREKKSLQGIADSVIETELEGYLRSNKLDLSSLNDKDSKIIVQDVRQKLRRLAGSFQQVDKDMDNPLLSHASTRERLEFYPALRQKLNAIQVNSILDLGCGINPLALATTSVKYHAYDINENDLSKVQDFFDKNNISGTTKVLDLRNVSNIDFPEADLCLMFKVLDVIDEKNHKKSEELIRKIKSRYLLISFSTKTLSGAPMRHPQRGWIERLLTRLGFTFESFSSKNEIFYLAAKERSDSGLN